MRNVVVQWARLGDLLQTRILLRNLAESFPGGEVILCADACYGEIARSFPEITEFWPIELSRLSALARHGESQAEFLSMLIDLAHDLRAKSVDNVYVVTRSLAASAFAELLNPAQVIGYRRNGCEICTPTELQVLDHDPVAFDRSVHLTDLWASFCPSNQPRGWMPPLDWPHASVSSNQTVVGIFCEAGEAHRTIPAPWLESVVKSWSSDESVTLKFFGKTAVADGLHQLAEQADGRISDLRGQTPLTQLCDHLASCQLLVGPDTGGLHLAAGLDVPVIGLYFGGAKPEFTGPYTEKAIVLQNLSWSAEEGAQLIAMGHQHLCGQNSGTASNGPCLVKYPQMSATGLRYAATAAVQSGKAPAALSIVIPECGATHYTDQLLTDLSAQNDCSGFEVILVTSGDSADRLLPIALDLSVRVVRSSEPLSFAQACNRGAREAVSDYLLFLNNDTRLSLDAIGHLLGAANPQEIISPLIVYPDDLIQNAGVTVRGNEVREIDHGAIEQSREHEAIDAVSAIAMLVSREAFLQNDGFDTEFVNGYEDLDFCLRLGRQGIRCRIEASSRVVHFRSSTTGRFDHEDANKTLFISRWAHVLERPFNNTKSNLRRHGVPLLFVSHEPAEAAGSRLRWIWPLLDLGLIPNRDFVWLTEADALADLDTYRMFVELAQGIIVFRPLMQADVQQILQSHVDRTGTWLCVDSDDLIIGRFPALSARSKSRTAFEAGFIALLQRASIVTASTSPLVESLQRFGLDATLLSTRPNSRQRKLTKTSAAKTTVNAGFFGTPAHLVDLGDILPALECALEANPHLMFYWWGCRPGSLAAHPQVRQGGPLIANYGDHLNRLHNFPLDFAIVPLLDAPSASVRSAIKYFEYSLAGIPAIYSAVKPYTDCITDQHNGLIVENTTPAWFDALNVMTNQPELRECLILNADHDMKDRLSSSVSRQALRRLIADLLRDHRPTCTTVPLQSEIPCAR
jgi:GT2 family glycosyltransferase/ADP-heptose:LPS heptosyltransferase